MKMMDVEMEMFPIPIQLGVWGCCGLPSGVQGAAPVENGFSVI